MTLAIVAITSRGADLAQCLADSLPDATAFLPEKFRMEDNCYYSSDSPGELLPRLFNEYDGLVCIMATGIVVRLLATHLRGKQYDPAVVVCDEAGEFAISLLSGHLGGANQLARQIADILDGQAVITTATDVNALPAWDDVAREEDLAIEPIGHIKHLNRRLLEASPIALVDPCRRIADRFAEVKSVVCCDTFLCAEEASTQGRVYVTHRLIPDLDRQPELLLLRPRDLVIGIGCNRGTDVAEIEAVVSLVLERAQLAFSSVCSVGTIIDKHDEIGINEFARRHSLAVEHFTAAELNQIEVPSAPSLHALQAVGAKGVCEPAALCAARSGRLLVRKQKSGNVTVAVAEKLGS
jgi:cobalt-precorrin 5A hydrolase